MTNPHPLSTLLSQALVACTVEFDNEAEHRRGPGRRPWLVSQAIWENVIRHIDGGGTTIEGVQRRARTTRLLLSGLTRWGYITVGGDDVIRLTTAGQHSKANWQSLTGLVDAHWAERFGPARVAGLRDALNTVVGQLQGDMPRYLPVVYPTQNGRMEDPATIPPPSPDDPSSEGPDLSTLLSRALHAFTLDFESQSRLSLTIAANTLRVLDDQGVRLSDLPALTGISKEGNAMCIGFLARRHCLVTERIPGATRGQQARLTPRGTSAQKKFRRLMAETEKDWRSSLGDGALDNLRHALEQIIDAQDHDGQSLLDQGMEPYPEGWRAKVRPPDTLPHCPMVLHRGGFPDGS